jgi:hypothetical protein
MMTDDDRSGPLIRSVTCGVTGRPTAIDPYRDTYMNEQESAAALREIHDLRQRCGDERQLAALDDLATVMEPPRSAMPGTPNSLAQEESGPIR